MLYSRCARTISILALTLFTAASAFAEPEVLDGIAAVVNKDVITFSQVRELVAPRERALRSQLQGPDLEEKVKILRTNALQDLIDRQLILQEFKGKEYKLPPYIVEEHIKAIIREEFGNDRGAFIRTLQAQGYTLSKFKDMERDKIIVQAMRGQNTKSDLAVPPTAVRAYFDKNKGEFGSNEQVKMRMIVIPKNAGESTTAASQRQLIDEIRQKVKNGADFAKMAQLYSQDSSAEVGGDWGWIDKKTLTPELTTRAFAIPSGGVGEVFEMAGNYYLLKIDARKEPTYPPFDEVKGQIESKLLQEERRKSQEKWLNTLREKAYIKRF